MSAPEHATHPAQASISVIVPTHNSARLLGESLDSILAQTLRPEQVIVVDDGSTDDTAAVVGRYKDRRIQYIRQPHGGVARARNAGLEAARGEYLTFLDAGDRWRPIFLEMMHAFLSEDPTVGSVFGNFVRFQHGTGKQLGDQFRQYPEIKRPVLLKDAPYAHGRIPREMAFSALLACGDIPAYPQVMMFRRSAIENVRFAPAAASDATSFALQAFLASGVIFTDVVLADVRRHDDDALQKEDAAVLHKLNGLKAVEPHVTRETDRRAYRDRLVKAHLDAALYQIRAGRVGAGFRTYRETFSVPGSALRKLRGSVRMAFAVPRGLAK
ncbi:MAG: glycosyltransferase family 2 protein [Pseudomonadota bacterium]|nr:glycosyltransferase family 2 protein [Pseudomonadota bacterium]